MFLLDCRARRLTPDSLDGYARRKRGFQAWFVEHADPQTFRPACAL